MRARTRPAIPFFVSAFEVPKSGAIGWSPLAASGAGRGVGDDFIISIHVRRIGECAGCSDCHRKLLNRGGLNLVHCLDLVKVGNLIGVSDVHRPTHVRRLLDSGKGRTCSIQGRLSVVCQPAAGGASSKAGRRGRDIESPLQRDSLLDFGLVPALVFAVTALQSAPSVRVKRPLNSITLNLQ